MRPWQGEMKLLYCLTCDDFVRLIVRERACHCGQTKGRYIDELHAEYEGPCVPVAIGNSEFSAALRLARSDEMAKKKRQVGHVFESWVIPWNSETVHRREPPERGNAT